MKQKILLKLAFILCTIITILFLDVFLVNSMVERNAKLVTAYVASHDIAPRTRITENDIVEIKISASYVEGRSYLSKEDIIGKITDIQGKIPAGSPFYISMLKKESDIPDFASLQLKDGQVSYFLDLEESILNSLVISERVDIYFEKENLSGLLFSHARILSIKDASGYPIDHEESTGIPARLEVAIAQEDVDILNIAKKNGDLTVFSTSESYLEEEALCIKDSSVYEFLMGLQ